MKNIYISACILLAAYDVNAYQTAKDPNDLSNFGWKVPVAMEKGANPRQMQLYLTKDLKMIWVSNDIADSFGRIPRHPITSTNDFINHHLSMLVPYDKLISYANVDFANIKCKQEKNIIKVINEEFAYRTYYTLKTTYYEIISRNLSQKKVRDFTIKDVEILKKGENMCIIYNEDVIDIVRNLKSSRANLRQRGFYNNQPKNIVSKSYHKKTTN